MFLWSTGLLWVQTFTECWRYEGDFSSSVQTNIQLIYVKQISVPVNYSWIYIDRSSETFICARVCFPLTVSSDRNLMGFFPIFLRMVSEIAFIFFPSPADLFGSEPSHSSVNCAHNIWLVHTMQWNASLSEQSLFISFAFKKHLLLF